MARMTTTASDHLGESSSGPPDAWVVAGRDVDGRPLPSLRQRLCPPMPEDRPWDWLGPVLVALFAGLVRLWDLGRPARFVFDETYYPKDAFGLLRFGVEQQFVDKANERILAGDLDVFAGPAFVVHPPAGKWMIALGEWVFGMNPFGWRIAVALLGTVSVLVMARAVRRLTRSTLLGCLAGFLLAIDGLHLVESRIALLDLPTMAWTLFAFAALLVDRDWARRRLADAVEPDGQVPPDGWGPPLLWRPWRLVAGLCFGVAVATKWNAAVVLAAFGLLTWAWDIGARRAIGVAFDRLSSWIRLALDTLVAFVTVVGSALVVYIASWAGWFASPHGYGRHWAESNPASGLASLVPDALRSLWHYHAEIMYFHTTLTDEHQYASSPWGWLIVARPVSFDWVDNIGPDQGCPTDRCVQEILGIGTPVLWWGAVLALVASLVWWLGARDWRFGVPVVGVAATWLPWFLYTDRPIFYFYAVMILPWLVIAVTLVCGKLLGPEDASPRRRVWGAAAVGGFTLLVLVNFAYLYPILTDQVIPYEDWLRRMWFRSWV
ncbi:dolichyl-phosphate-mannose-protein mannosyltransferase [Thermasporomyces composti]|jgi:dolichyl-phosphate-mannose-protein mannosyltransferase|uniref:Polyprenol-phosphate-mannose--protein mannosyltransferase n=2 Tax=Thermasporomyces composti TaxID=696763 RepID=A0A3D9V2L6_THECX|nr:dolichyl-phosphate-mannose-protein mannosyltransferase [Thermasporomyces composti]